MSEVRRDFGISRKTGYKIFNRYRDQGLEVLTDRSRRPVRYANQLPDQVERLIVDLKREQAALGRAQNPRTARSQACRDVRLPARSTVHAVLDRHGLVNRARIGIAIERIKPGHPQQNGRHERMHLTLKKEKQPARPVSTVCSSRPGSMPSCARVQRRRPHEALAMRCPAEFYTASPRPYDGLPELQYPWHYRDILVTACGRIGMHRKKINISTVLAGQKLGIREVDDGI